MSDEELDRQWKPSRRPQSTMARNFSVDLDNLFKIDNSLADLDAAVDQKKKAVSSKASELEALEAAIRATEERLKATSQKARNSSPRARQPLADTFAPRQSDEANIPTSPSPLSNERPRTANRPSTARKAVASPGRQAPPLPGARPPTPGASDEEEQKEFEQGRG